MKLPGFFIAAGLMFAGLAGSTAALAQPAPAGFHQVRDDHGRGGRDGRFHRGAGRDHRRWHRPTRAQRHHGPRCRTEWRRGHRVRVCR